MSVTVTRAVQVADMATASQSQLEELAVPGSIVIDGENQSLRTSADDLFTYFIAKLESEYSIKFKAGGVISLWNEDINDYMDIKAQGADGYEDIDFTNN
jgi:hypothetical protein